MAPNQKASGGAHFRATSVILLIVVTVSISGFFMGLRQTVSDTRDVHEMAAPSEESHAVTAFDEHAPLATQAVSYAHLSEVRRGPNAHWDNSFSKLKTTLTEEEKATLHEARQSRRAYEGAPPVVPHPVVQSNSLSCLLCHDKATRIGDRIAPAVSHEKYASCTQCHVEDSGVPLEWNTASYLKASTSRFEGVHNTDSGTRAYQGAPPTIPHRTWMRENCMSCHGDGGTSEILTSHPDRQSCTQCHAVDADLDQREFLKTVFP